MNTRIKKYLKLRQQVEQEIKLLKLKQNNNEKIKKFKTLIDEIDSKIFEKNEIYIDGVFPELKSFSKIEKEKDENELFKISKKLKIIINEINNIKVKNQKSKINDYIPKLENEDFILNNLNLIKNKNISENFETIKNEKNKIIEKSKKINELEIENLDLKNIISENILNIEQKKERINKISQFKKYKTKWLYFLNIILLLIQITCLILLTTIS